MWQWDDVRFFLALSRNRSLSGAARALGVDHATVGRRLTAFEEELGSKLFDRTPEGFATTAAGEAILSECEAMENAASSVDRLVAGHDARLSGLVRVATTELLAQVVVVPALAQIAATHPQLQVDIVAHPRPVDIARRQADVAVRFVRPRDGDLVCRKLGEFGMTRYASRAYLGAHGVPKSGQHLEGHTSVGYLTAPSWFNETLGGAHTVLFSNSPYVQLAAMAAGVGIGVAPCCVGDEYPGLVRLVPGEAPELRPVWVIMHRDLRRVARIRIVANAIAEVFEHKRQLLRFGARDIAKARAPKQRALTT
ncbi:MAG TPA: LysR family transcriptional regulator [Candidatus Binataceae bacterium]|nr:LysR family transcriptional regulator [Candidatus Binataceae bacterium]